MKIITLATSKKTDRTIVIKKFRINIRFINEAIDYIQEEEK